VTLTLQPHVLTFWTTRARCIACKHKPGPMLLPTGTDDPRSCRVRTEQLDIVFNGDNLLHLSDTHGFDNDTIVTWVLESIYGIPLSWA
jgi:hypothetical protein